MKKAVTLNTLYQLLARAISAGTSLLITIVISRQLGVFQFGELIKVISYVSLFYMPIDFGINAIALKKYRANKQSQTMIFSNLLLLRLLLSLATISIAVSIAYFLPGTAESGFSPLVKKGIYIFSLTVLVQALIKTSNSILQNYLEYQYLLLAEISQATIILSLIFLVLPHYPTFLIVIVGYVIGGLFAFATQLIAIKKRVSFSLSEISLLQVKNLLIPAIPLGITIVINTLSNRIDILSLTYFRSTAEVGNFGLAKRIMELFFVVPTFIANSYYPILLRSKTITALIKKFTPVMAMVGTVCSLALWSTAPLLTLINFDFELSIQLLRLYGMGLPLYFISSPLMWGLIARNQERSLFRIYLTSFTINLILTIILVPYYGALGAIATTLLAECVTILLLTKTFFTKHDQLKTN